jgi:hypothetical protein
MAYVNSDYYKNTFKGTLIPDASLDSYLQRASDTVDELTYQSISSTGLSNLTTFQQGKVKMAVCYQAEHLYNYGDTPATGLKSYSAGDNSVNFGDNSDIRYSRLAVDYLMSTGLLYRGLL